MKGNFHLEVFVEIGVLDHQVARHYGQREVHLSGEEKRGERESDQRGRHWTPTG